MPKRNGTGPEGRGPATGRGLGGCKGNTPVKETTNNTKRGRKLDGTGPLGKGPKTGQGLGNCK